MNKYRTLLIWLAAASWLPLSGCSLVAPEVTAEEREKQRETDRTEMFSEQEALDGPLTLYQAMARALKYNLDYRTKLLDAAVAEGTANVARYDLLPQLTTSGGYSARSSENAATSKTMRNGVEGTDATTSAEREHVTGSLGVSWNVLDFGISYIRARQQSNRLRIAEERRRKAAQTIIQDVRAAWWRAAAGERRKGDLERITAKIQLALTSARKIEDLGLQPPTQILEYQKGLLDSQRQLQQLTREVALAMSELRGLINLDPSQTCTLALPPEQSFIRPEVPSDMRALERQALLQRPELREEDYQGRITTDETRKALLKMLPGLQFDTGVSYDSNRYLLNSSWAEAGLKLTWNLVNLISAPATRDLAEVQEDQANKRRLALSMAVLTQVQVAYRRFMLSSESFDNAAEFSEVENRLFDHAVAGERASTSNELEVIRREANWLSARLRRDLALVESKNAAGNLHIAIGDDPFQEAPQNQELGTLARQLRAGLAAWDGGDGLAGETATTKSPVLAATWKIDGEAAPPPKIYQPARKIEAPQAQPEPQAQPVAYVLRPPPKELPKAAQSRLLHLQSARNRFNAALEWQNLTEHHPEMARFSPATASVEVKGMGRYFRLYAKGDEEGLTRACEGLRRKNVYCALQPESD